MPNLLLIQNLDQLNIHLGLNPRKTIYSLKQNKLFTENKKSNNEHVKENITAQHSLSEIKRKKLMHVLDDLVQLKKTLDTDK